MKLPRMLFKPGWQDKDPARRLGAIESGDDAQMIAALPEVARSDPDPRVRLAALRRLGDYECWRAQSTADADAEVRRTARSAYLSMLCAGGPDSPALPRLIAELDTLSATETETVATAATNRGLRAEALARVTRPALLAERAGADPDPALRLAALGRIGDAGILKRIAERTRKTDKAIHRAARERLQALRIEGGDIEAIAARATGLCERAESLLRAPGPDRDAVRTAIETEWTGLGESVPDDLVTRFQGAVSLLRQPLDAPRSDAGPSVPDARPEMHHDAAAPAVPGAGEAVETSVRPNTEEVSSRARFDAAVSAAAEQARREGDRREATAQRIEALLPRLAAALDAGDTAAAQAADADIAHAAKALDGVPRSLEHELAPLHARLAELRRWQHWSNQRRRRALCAEIEALPTSGLHPDALATRIHEARAEWAQLDAMEGHTRGGEASGLGRRFFGLCQRALKPAQAYFARRDSVRDARRDELDALLGRFATLPAESEDWSALSRLRQQLARALRSLGTLNPRDRNAYARRLKEAIAALSTRVEGHDREIESAKSRLIEQAREVAGREPDRGNARAVRELQQQWSALGNGRRAVDQKQWREFRKACDEVFAALDGERRQRQEDDAAQLERARGLLDEGQGLLDDTTLASDELAVRRRDLDARWRSSAPADRALDRRYRQLSDALAARSAELLRAARLARFADALHTYSELRDFECGRSAMAPDATGEEGTGGFAELADRCRRAAEGAFGTADATTLEAARDTLIRLEFLGGVATPAEDTARRMNYQVSRLSARMRGEDAASPEQELATLMAEWFALAGQVPGALDERFEQAARAALATLP